MKKLKLKNDKNWTVILCSSPTGEYIHEHHIRKSNPDAQILKIDFTNEKYRETISSYPWREPDKIIRSWMKEHKDEIEYNNVVFMEYDLLITKQLPNIFLENEILGSAAINPVEHKWWVFFNESNKLGCLEEYSCALLLFCFYCMSRNCIDYWVDSKYDYLYTKEVDILCELRMPTILRSCGISVGNLPGVGDYIQMGDRDYDLSIPGYYHPVKTRIDNI